LFVALARIAVSATSSHHDALASFVPDWNPIPYELRIGIAGHRDLPNPEAVSAKVREVLDTLMGILADASANPFGPHGSPQSRAARFDRRLAELFAAGTAPVARLETWAKRRLLWPSIPVSPRHPTPRQQTPIKPTAISALAPGADRIVTQAICEVVRSQPTVRNRYVEAVLPFPPTACEEECSTVSEVEEFRALLALDCGADDSHAEHTVCFSEFPVTRDPAHSAGEVTREDAYAAAGRKVVDTSEIVLALWNPAIPSGPGGTEDTVREALDRGRLVVWLNPARLDQGVWALRPRRPGPAFHDAVDAPGPQPSDVPTFCRVVPLPAIAKELSPNFHRLAAYNRDAAVAEDDLHHAWIGEAGTLTAHARRCALPEPVTQVLVGQLLPRFVRADLLSQRYARLRNAAARVWPLSVALVVTLMAFQVVFLPSWYWLAAVELVVLLAGYASNRISAHEGWHEKWLHDRRLAEGLRSALYAVLTGRPSSPVHAGTGHVQGALPFYDPANAWYVASMKREVAKGRRQFDRRLSLDDPNHRGAVRCVLLDAWIRPQAAHHHASATRHRRRALHAKRLRLGLLGVILAVAAAHAVGAGHRDHGSTAAAVQRVDLWLGFLTVSLPAWAAAFHAIGSLDDHDRLSDRSERMAGLIEGLAERLASAGTAEDLRERAAEAEAIMDLESSEWAESLVDRRPEFTG
jgi:hypothetical protein